MKVPLDIQNGIKGRLDTPAVGEIGFIEDSATGFSTTTTSVASTYVDSNDTITLPIGIFVVRYNVQVQLSTGATAGNRNIYAQTIVREGTTSYENSTAFVSFVDVPASTSRYANLSGEDTIVVTTPTTFKVSVRCNLATGGTGGTAAIIAGGITTGVQIFNSLSGRRIA